MRPIQPHILMQDVKGSSCQHHLTLRCPLHLQGPYDPAATRLRKAF
ncbi:hypothetical protein BDA96_10G144600 [Sorghum bicolor]|uniref:Uncharacterized protein n=1 Tax=Sorghum bicolor TaxID=4558 RepID=A0A921Q254_SORBI|nr:hypothetical protein BDA96_10G144600 [Sorghum bicolor]